MGNLFSPAPPYRPPIEGPERDEVCVRNGVPENRRLYQNHHFNSERWNQIDERDDDIIIVTAGKSGTTWCQTMIYYMLFSDGNYPLDAKGQPMTVHEVSPWIDCRVPPDHVLLPPVRAQKHRRFLKTHLPADAMKYRPKAKYIYVARDMRDMQMSAWNHYRESGWVYYLSINLTPGRIGPVFPRYSTQGTAGQQLERALVKGCEAFPDETDGFPGNSLLRQVRSWWQCRNMPNVMFLHYNEMLFDMEGQMRRLANFLEIDVAEDKWDAIVEKCTFKEMKKNAKKYAPLGGKLWKGGANTFINKGQIGRWRKHMNPTLAALNDEKRADKLSPGCNYYLETGDFAGGCLIDMPMEEKKKLRKRKREEEAQTNGVNGHGEKSKDGRARRMGENVN